MPYRSTRIEKPGHTDKPPIDVVVLTHDERHLRRKLLHMVHDDVVMLDLKEPVVLEHGDLLALEGGGHVEVIAADEKLLEIKARNLVHQMELAWHLGNRHLATQIEEGRILIERDHVIQSMLAGLGAVVTEVVEPFHPVHGAYHSHASHGHGSHDHGSHDHHDHDH
ncbi:urease accessory protein UreE [Rhizobium sp. LjRoot254]|uniref:urease accessory protein UreE n=1 Tax=Rhizobium sp. LjRoot254 TaxID=3342297 RepID=UPI003ECE01CD